ncbi:MAG: peptidoglycan-binding domain-containing protein [Pseudomonadota bacterium]
MNFVFLDVAIGLATIFFLVATFCAGVQEVMAGYLNLRGKTLWEGIQSILIAGDMKLGDTAAKSVVSSSDPGNRIAQDMLMHPLIRGQVPDKFGIRDLFHWLFGSRQPTADSGDTKPSYLQAATFAVTLLDTIRKTYRNADASPTNLHQAIDNMPDSELKKTLLSFVDKAGGDMEKTQQAIESWFDEAMTRVSGWYKRRTQALLFLIGLTVAVIFNIDSIQIFKQLWREPTVREMVIRQADNITNPAVTQYSSLSGMEQAEKSLKLLNALPPALPLGWPAAAWSETPPVEKASWSWLCDALLLLAGWLITASAATMGAPFWFELISKLLPLRSSGKPAGDAKPKADAAATATVARALPPASPERLALNDYEAIFLDDDQLRRIKRQLERALNISLSLTPGLDPATRQAIRAVQKQHGLPETGYLDAALLHTLIS